MSQGIHRITPNSKKGRQMRQAPGARPPSEYELQQTEHNRRVERERREELEHREKLVAEKHAANNKDKG